MQRDAIRRLLEAAGEVVADSAGNVVGYVAQPARFKVNRPYLSGGGFLIVTRHEETGEYSGTEFDALAHPKTGEPYPAGHSEWVWSAPTLESAEQQVLAYFVEVDGQ